MNQAINFVNLSTNNSGSNILRYLWVFKNYSTGTMTTSTAFEPSPIFMEEGEYLAILTVTNECNCSNSYELKFTIKNRGFEISCPSVICEGQSSIYSLPFDGMEICRENFNWSVEGGQILSEAGGNVEVLWNSVDENGFGYVTFNPIGCNLDCLEPTTIKIPVIQSIGTIQGPTEICFLGQGRYKLPQWPTTDIQWEIIGNNNNELAEIILTDQRNEIIVTPLTSGLLTLRATYMNTLLHCGGEAEIIFNVVKPTEIIGENAFCINSPATFSNSQNGLVNWILTTNSGTTIATLNESLTFLHTFNQSGNYILKAEGNGYCSGEQKNINVLAKPAAPSVINGNLQVCPNSVYSYSIQNPNPSNDYIWEVTNGYFVGADTGNQVNITFNGTFPAEIKVYQKTLSPIACFSEPKIITINQFAVDAIISSEFSAICANSVASYQALNSSDSTLYSDGDTYLWSFANATNLEGNTLVASSLGSISNGQGTNSVNVTWNNVTSVTTLDLVLTIGKCTIAPSPRFVKQITLYPKTEIEITASENPICAGNLYPVTFTVSSINGVPLAATDQVTWNFGAGNYTTAPGVFSQTSTFNNNSTVNISQIVTAFIENANGCGQTNTSSVAVTILPNPPAIATLTSSYNGFCNVAQINASITVSSNTDGVTFEWFRNGFPLNETATTLYVTPSLGFGNYTFRATNPNGCISESNPIGIYEFCEETDPCEYQGTITNTSYLSSCNQITLQGSATGNVISEEWLILGPGPENYTINGSILTGEPGNYNILYVVEYPCSGGENGTFSNLESVVIPFKPDFSYVVECANNNSFNVNLIDNSTFFAPVTNQQVRFYYKLASAANFIGPIAYNPDLSVFEMENLPPGNYTFKQEVEGNNYPTCSKQFNVNLQGVNQFLSIVVNEDLPIKCHDTPVKFGLNVFSLPVGSTVLWDFGDGATNTMEAVSRVFDTPGASYTITCTITNPNGCSRVLTANITIPNECFFGDIVATPSNASVCEGQSVTLTYVPNNDNCAVANYIWMKGNEPLPNAPNSNQLTVTSSDFYWVKLRSNQRCEYNSPTQIKPVFQAPPTINLIGNTTYCENDDVVLQINTNAPISKWFVNTDLYPQFNDLTEAVFSGLALGSYTITVVATSGEGCENSTSQLISVQEAVNHIDFDVQIECEPSYQVTITAIASNGSNITYNWSNGATGTTIVVPDGGPYKVTANIGSCSTSAQIDVPKNPENYSWIFPTGCFDDCSTDLNYLIGPNLPLKEWSWNLDAQSVASGAASYADAYSLVNDGTYTFTMNTGACSFETAPLAYSTSECDKCKFEKAGIKDIKQNDTPYCSYTFTLVIYSAVTFEYQATFSDDTNQVVVIPSSFTIFPGENIIEVTAIPQSPFMGGEVTFIIQGTVPFEGGYENCTYKVPVDVPWCGLNNKIATKTTNNKEVFSNSFSLYPNPSSSQITLSYPSELKEATLELFDLTGRSITKKALNPSDSEATLAVDTYPAGMYMLVVKQADTILWQNKLIIN